MTDAFEHIDLPSGAWIEIRDPEQTTEEQRRPVMNYGVLNANSPVLQALFGDTSMVDATEHDVEIMFGYNDRLAVCLIQAWSYDLPVTVAGLLQIPGVKDMAEIRAATLKHRDALMPDFGVSVDPESPSNASNDSGTVVEAPTEISPPVSQPSSVFQDPESGTSISEPTGS